MRFLLEAQFLRWAPPRVTGGLCCRTRARGCIAALACFSTLNFRGSHIYIALQFCSPYVDIKLINISCSFSSTCALVKELLFMSECVILTLSYIGYFHCSSNFQKHPLSFSFHPLLLLLFNICLIAFRSSVSYCQKCMSPSGRLIVYLLKRQEFK